MRLRLPQKLGLALVAAFGASTFVSVAPSLTAFKVYQMLVLLMFTAIFVQRYGVEACLQQIFRASVLLCVADAIAAFSFPKLVLVTTETGATRLRGDYIASTEFVALLCLVLLIAEVQKTSKMTYSFLLALSCTLLVASLSRTAYLALAVTSLMVLFKSCASKPFRRFTYVFGITTATLAIAFSVATEFGQYRDPESMLTLSDRLGLWSYLFSVTLQKSPVIGLGYYAASRVYGPKYNTQLGGAHSLFVEAFAGGGILAIVVLAILCIVLLTHAVRVYCQSSNLALTVAILFVVSVMFWCVGGDLDSGPGASLFWCLAAILPLVQTWGFSDTVGNCGSKRWLLPVLEHRLPDCQTP